MADGVVLKRGTPEYEEYIDALVLKRMAEKDKTYVVTLTFVSPMVVTAKSKDAAILKAKQHLYNYLFPKDGVISNFIMQESVVYGEATESHHVPGYESAVMMSRIERSSK